MRNKRKGFTLAEILVYIVVGSGLILIFSTFFATIVKGTKKSQWDTYSLSVLRTIISKFDLNISEANEIIEATPTSVEFICDIMKNPNWNFIGRQDADFLENYIDTDVDFCAKGWNNTANFYEFNPNPKYTTGFNDLWKVGLNLEDDDDNQDDRVDVIIKIYFDAKSSSVYQGVCYDAVSYNNRLDSNKYTSFMKLGLANKCQFRFFGSTRYDNETTKKLDKNNDGIIDEKEIDTNIYDGNSNGKLDSDYRELKYIASIQIYLELDVNNDGKIDASLYSEVAPPLLPLKRLRKSYD